jgi:hypothetical protein
MLSNHKLSVVREFAILSKHNSQLLVLLSWVKVFTRASRNSQARSQDSEYRPLMVDLNLLPSNFS